MIYHNFIYYNCSKNYCNTSHYFIKNVRRPRKRNSSFERDFDPKRSVSLTYTIYIILLGSES
mgnify:CR=1 FL=1